MINDMSYTHHFKNRELAVGFATILRVWGFKCAVYENPSRVCINEDQDLLGLRGVLKIAYGRLNVEPITESA